MVRYLPYSGTKINVFGGDKMSLVSEQNIFSADVARLIQRVHDRGFGITFGEAWRPEEMQAIYLKNGKSKTAHSRHQDRLAVDFNFFKVVDGKLVLTYAKNDLQEIGDYWESLDKKNKWGGNFCSEFVDCPHFERML